MAHTHRYSARCSWRGSTAQGYEHYRREHEAQAPPADAVLTLSADPAFRGDSTRLNPEQLLLIAAASCQLLSFLAVAARARIDVREYDDQAEAVMPDDDPPPGLTRIVLRPRIVVGPGCREERVRHLVELAHQQCYVANSLRTPIDVEPSIVVLDEAPA